MTRADRVEGARLFIADLSDADLTHWRTLDRLIWAARVPQRDAERLVSAEKLKRGLIALNDLRPDQRRQLVEKDKVDLHALAAGPIMDPAQLYLPAGTISLAEAIERERAGVQKL